MENERRVIVALDNMTLQEAATMTELVMGEAAGVKVGFELLCDEGAKNIMAALPAGASVFFDPKLHDIPNTAAQTARKLVGRGAWIINMHCSGGRLMMQHVRQAVDEAWENEGEDKRRLARKPLLFGVTVLTSLNYAQLAETIMDYGWEPATEHISAKPKTLSAEEEAKVIQVATLKMALVAEECGLDGIVTSPQEVAVIRKKMSYNPNFQIITPGIRLESGETNDQIRIATPAGAIKAGANWLVIGRPVTQADDPKAALRLINQQVTEALAGEKMLTAHGWED